jgi:hypothetical protein
VRERDHLEHLGVDGRILLIWIFNKLNEGLHWFWIGTGNRVVVS